jgi:single-strand DNA-binding protein
MPLMRVAGEVGVVRFDPDKDLRFTEAGKCWVRFRGVSKERKRDSNGTWSDGDPVFLDYLVFGKYAEHFADSVSVGDTVLLEGRLAPNVWTGDDGVKHEDLKVMVDSIGPALLWGPAKTERTSGEPRKQESKADEGQDDLPPF